MTTQVTSIPSTRTNASEALRADLQRVLVDLTDLHIQGKQAHWNVTGRGFRNLHLQLDEVVDLARDHADVIAERMRALQIVPDARAQVIAESSDLAVYPSGLVSVRNTIGAIVERITQTVAAVREVHDEVDAEDPATSDLLHTIINDLEKQAWMIASEDLEA